MVEYDLVEGLDPTPLASISASQLLQMVRQAAPNASKGFIIYSALPPDVVNNPRYKRFFWVDISTVPNTVYYFDTTVNAFSVLTAAASSVVTSSIVNGAVTPIKIQPGAVSTFLQTDVGGNVVWAPYAIPNGSIDLVKLIKGGNGQFIRTKADGSAIEWFNFDLMDYLVTPIPPAFIDGTGGLVGEILQLDSTLTPTWTPFSTVPPNGSLGPVKLTPGLAKQVLQTNLAGGAAEWTDGTTLTVGWISGIGPTWDTTVTKPSTARWRAFDIRFVGDVVGANVAPFGAMKIDLTYQTAPLAGSTPGTGASGVNFTDIIAVVGAPTWDQAGMMAPQLQDTDTIAFRATATILPGTTTLRGNCNMLVKAYYV